MFVGHAAIAFALVGLGARALGVSRARAVTLAGFAAAVAVLPDVDILYALSGFAGVGSLEPFALANGFWDASTAAHRSLTHSLVVALPAAAAIGLVAAGGRNRVAGIGALTLGAIAVVLGAQPAIWVGSIAFLAGAFGLGLLAARWGISARVTAPVAAVALLSHPFGDLFTGSPPALFYPLEITAFAERVTLATDPTLHLLGAFFLELAAIWLGVHTLIRLRHHTIGANLHPRAAIGGAYAIAVLFLPAPTLEASYHFVFSVTAVGFVGIYPPRRTGGMLPRIVTGLAAVTVAGAAYAMGYLLLGF